MEKIEHEGPSSKPSVSVADGHVDASSLVDPVNGHVDALLLVELVDGHVDSSSPAEPAAIYIRKTLHLELEDLVIPRKRESLLEKLLAAESHSS